GRFDDEVEGEDYEYDRRARIRRDSEPHRGGLILTFGIVSVVAPFTYCLAPLAVVLGLVGWVMGSRDLRKMRANVMDERGHGSTQGGYICSIIGTVLGLLVSLVCVGQILLSFWSVREAQRQVAVAAAGGGGGAWV